MTTSNNPNWLQRNWKWVVPGGCLGLLLLCAVFISVIFLSISTALKSSEIYQLALEKALTTPEVIEALGEPIEPGFMPSGSIQVSGPTGQAELSIPISGPKNSGTIYVVAQKSVGTWQFWQLEVAINGREEWINLLE
jgi:hypothetical protein